MDFDLSKENVQPLRGGRNPTQLEVALQAQDNVDYQKELLLQKEEFERAIQNYAGDDPLENWYHYISWIEQSYPKRGHEGNLVNLLEDCLVKFENDKRYTNDFRFCKLWIKYNDLQQNPTELYQMMYARGLCRGCADLYKAWAYYHELAGDYKNSDLVFQKGRQELAQPYDDLIMAHNSLYCAYGQQKLTGVNEAHEQRLLQQRQALMNLHTYKPGRVGTVRCASASGSGTWPSGAPSSRSNTVVPIYEDRGDIAQGAEAAPISILSVARRQVAPKENTIKPGTWTSSVCPQLKGQNRAPKFAVHEDIEDSKPQGIRLPQNHYPVTHEDFSHWKPQLCYAEPDDPSRIPMYPKSRVYSRSDTEYSIEEIRACRYLKNRLNVSHVETEQAIQSILADKEQFIHIYEDNYPQELYQDDPNNPIIILDDDYQEAEACAFVPHLQIMNTTQPQVQIVNATQPQIQIVNTDQNHVQPIQVPHLDFGNLSQHVLFCQQPDDIPSVVNISHNSKGSSRIFGQNLSDGASFHSTSIAYQQSKQEANEVSFIDHGHDMDDLWRSAEDSVNDSIVQSAVKPKNTVKFSIYEESHIAPHMQPKGSAMKTMPFKILTDEDLAETGSRGGHDIAAAAQPGDSAKRIEIFEDDNTSSEMPMLNQLEDLSAICTTQVFNFNLNEMKVSTPHAKVIHPMELPLDCVLENAKKQLFDDEQEKKRMSTILEETKSSGSSGCQTSLKTSAFCQSKKDNMAVISEESNYNFNLAQNSKANAALRTSLLEFMECESGQSSPVAEVPIVPLEQAPSNPFKLTLLRSLLDRVGFPGRHSNGFISIATAPKLQVKKEVTFIGGDPYIIDKLLGKGTYGQVFRATDCSTGRVVALKIQKPANSWEFYICRELQARLDKHPLRQSFMEVTTAYFSDDVSIFVSEFSPCGSLLDVVNKFKTRAGHPLRQSPTLYFAVEMLKIVATMHQVRIIHADIKPDNFLVYVLPDSTIQLQLIDFGCSINLSFFPEGTTFTRRVTTKDFICPEMLEGRPWSFHTDLFCVAATTHVLLFDKYMQLQKKGDQWSITQRFARNMRVDLWNMFFSTLLNQQKGPADPEKLLDFLTSALNTFGQDYNMEMRKLVNILNNR